MFQISSQFDGGNINVIDATSPSNIRLSIHKDHQSDFYQWFYFRLSNAKGQLCVLHIENAGGAAYPKGWDNYQVAASYDREHWFRVGTHYKDERLTIQHIPETDCIYFAYFAPYSLERHHDLIARVTQHDDVNLHVPGLTLDGRDIDLLTIGQAAADKKNIWVIARQHPGETMAEWLVEGMLDRLLDSTDALSRSLRERAVFHIVPNMNPDGSYRGHLRTNAAGINLNRQWDNPTVDTSPEVFFIRHRMIETGVDMVLDVHGDEALPYNFIAGTEGIPDFSDRQRQLLFRFKNTLEKTNPDFQTQYGYPVNPAGKANLSFCSNQLAARFDCLAMTLEQPFKDTANTPQPETGWSPPRAKKLGASLLEATADIIDVL
ncbi:MAG: hypothetical protein CMF31_06140 [Kordiimonas sp.]|nr:hypothetical protein [Kordiimonas sp.]